jgi:hypothetical protein
MRATWNVEQGNFMVKFKLGGAGPDNIGLGTIVGIDKKFKEAGEVYETNSSEEISILRNLTYTGLAEEIRVLETELEEMSWRMLISLGSKLGVYKPGLNRIELTSRIINKSC